MVMRHAPGTVPLDRAMSALGLASRADAIALIRAGRVLVDGRAVADPAVMVAPGRIRLAIDTRELATPPRATILFNKPRGVMTTRRDPRGRPTAFGRLEGIDRRLAPVGRLDMASTGLLLLTNDTRLFAWLTDPANRVRRTDLVRVRGAVTEAGRTALERGLVDRGERLAAAAVRVRTRSARESHLVIEHVGGGDREIRRLCEAMGHPVTRLSRAALGGLTLGALSPGAWRALPLAELTAAFPDAPLSV